MNTPFTFDTETFEWIAPEPEIPLEFEEEVPPQGPVPLVRNFSSSDADCAAALRSAGKSKAQALALINAQLRSAIHMLRVASNKLKPGVRTAPTDNLFKKIFRVPPTFVPTWLKPTAAIKNRGDVVAVRCRRVADLLASGRIRFFCSINSANCPDCGNDNSDFACSSWGDESVAPNRSNVICLGAPFWDDMKRGNRTSTLSTLIHEPFHIYFGKYVTAHARPGGESVGKFGGINCIVRFVFEVNGLTAPKRVVDRCVGTPVRSAATGF